MEGNLQRWTGYLRGYQWRVFVLKNGCLRYYRSTDDSRKSANCRGTLQIKYCRIDKLARFDFLISSPGSPPMYLRAMDEVDRQKWINAMEQASRGPSHSSDDYVVLSNEDGVEESNSQLADNDEGDEAVVNLQRSLNFQLGEVQSCHTDLGQLVHSLQRELSSLETSQVAVAKQLKPLFEKMMLVKISADTLLKRSNDFVGLSDSQTQSWISVVQRERQRRRRLEEAVETIARQHNVLEASVISKSAAVSTDTAEHDETDGGLSTFSLHATLDGSGAHRPNTSNSSDDDQSEDIFVDCVDNISTGNSRDGSVSATNFSSADASTNLEAEEDTPQDWPLVRSARSSSCRQHRCTVLDRPDIPVNLWSILKNCIGQDLSRIAMPVMINEPLSFLQRLCEVNMEYSDLLDQAAKVTSSTEQMALICAFAVASYSSTSYRTKKPFNPLLGETYELDRTADLGWRCVCEQVSHHPPESAMHVESEEWQFWEDYTMSSKFRGKYAQILPHGSAHLLFRRTGHHYTWNKPITTVHNVIVGKLWIDSSGDMAVVNHTTQDMCTMMFHEFSYFSKSPPRRVTGTVYDRTKLPCYSVTGTWDGSISSSKVLESKIEKKLHVATRCEAPVEIWRARNIPEGHSAKYCFSEFTCCLNEEDDSVAPTDSRRRPDQRVMETGNFDKANEYKVLLEEKQRQRRRDREAKVAEVESRGADSSVARHRPRFFRVEKDEITSLMTHRYVGGYWEAKQEQDWGECLDLYSLN
ncbi:oxysterol-binding protein 1-like [Sycon ciliatum]|uniref:oxysterol-binding protein 1-like n=1 Tax=Sycon ciliatum TaxID=27933 RepID=UPI0031F6BD44